MIGREGVFPPGSAMGGCKLVAGIGGSRVTGGSGCKFTWGVGPALIGTIGGACIGKLTDC